MRELIKLWTKTLDTRPVDDQFTLWGEMHTSEVIRQAILKTRGRTSGVQSATRGLNA
jgi:hypothetical protein